MADIDKKYVKGLKFKGANRKPSEEPGGRDRHEKFERPLTVKDVLSFSETETHVNIVAADGQKYEVAK